MTYTAPPEYADLAAQAFAPWTQHSALRASPGGHDIDILVAPLREPIVWQGQPAQAWVRHAAGVIEHCEVLLDPVYWPALTAEQQLAVLTHELGHCLGIDHSEEPSIMRNPFLYPWSGDDDQASRAVAPYPHRVVIPGVQR